VLLKFITSDIMFILLVCEKCNLFYEGDCPEHLNIKPCADSATTSTDTNKALASVPEGMEVRGSNIPGAGLGVFATRGFAIGSTFGPYDGDKIKGNVPKSGLDTSYMWEVSCDWLIGRLI
jgi:hypothetical protein